MVGFVPLHTLRSTAIKLSQGEHAGFEAKVFLQKTLASNATTAPEYVDFCRG
jgi:hypothetical protein